MEATIRDLRLHTAEVLAAVEREGRVVVTSRGHACAVLTRCESECVREGRNPAFGLWQDRHEPVDDQVRRMRQGRAMP